MESPGATVAQSNSSSEVCVIGAGIVGLAAAACLHERGVEVACLDSGRPGDGQSAGRTRQFRHLHREPELIELAVQARRGWLRWEERFGRQLLGREGAFRVGAERAELEALRAAGVPAEELDPDQAAGRFPIRGLFEARDGQRVLWDPLAGAIRAQDTIGVLAGGLGPVLMARRVDSIHIEPGEESVTIRTDQGVHHCARCVVCAGAGTDRLVRGLAIAVHQARQAHLRLAFPVSEPAPGGLPCYSDRSGMAGEIIYGLDDLDGRYAVGLAPVGTYPAVGDLAAEVPADVDVAPQRRRIIDYVRAVLPGLHPAPVDEVLRLTTTLPDHPEDGFEIHRSGPVIAIAGPNLFKFAPVLGELLAQAAIDERETDAAPVTASR